jgi:hypothetical protein
MSSFPGGKGGRGIRNILSAWFHRQTTQDLLRMQSKHMKLKDVILLSHLKGRDQGWFLVKKGLLALGKSSSVEHRILIKYFLSGMKKTLETFNGDDLDNKASACLAYIERADRLKRSGSDSAAACTLVKEHYFDIGVVPTVLYSDEAVS